MNKTACSPQIHRWIEAERATNSYNLHLFIAVLFSYVSLKILFNLMHIVWYGRHI